MRRTRLAGLSSLPFERQLTLAFVAGLLLLTIVSTLVLTYLSTERVRDTLIELGRNAAESLASDAGFALATGSPENVAQQAQAILRLPAIVGIDVLDVHHTALYRNGSTASVAATEVAWPQQTHIQSETEREWYFVSPVYLGEAEAASQPFSIAAPARENLGFVRVTVSKEPLHAARQETVSTTTLVTFVLATALLLYLITITRRVTGPIRELGDYMDRARQGERGLRASPGGSPDVRQMQHAFNALIATVEQEEMERTAAHQAALESARLKGELVSAVSHELRSPLSGITGTLDLLAETELSRKQQDYVDLARTSVVSLLLMADEILDFSRLPSEADPASVEPFYLPDVLDDVLTLLSSQARRKGLQLAYQISPDCHRQYEGPAGALRQVLTNLTSNAVKFTQQGHVHISVETVDAPSGATMLRITVEDTGAGIDQEAQQAIFESLGGERRVAFTSGTGLGLAVSKAIVDACAGSIGVNSRANVGSRFHFTLPAKVVDSMQSHARRTTAIHGLRVLVASADDFSQKAINAALRSWGAFSSEAHDGNGLVHDLEQARRGGRPYDLVVADDKLRDFLPEGAVSNVVLLSTEWTHDISGTLQPHPVVPYPLRESDLFEAISKLILMNASRSHAAPIQQRALNYAPSVLIADNDQTLLEVSSKMLQKLGCAVTVAYNAREVIKQAADSRYDLIFLDLHLHGVSGFEVAKALRARPGYLSSVPIVGVAAHVGPEEARAGAEFGMVDYLAKPIRLDALRSVVDKWLVGATDTGEGPSQEHEPTGSVAWTDPSGLLAEEDGDEASQSVEHLRDDWTPDLRALTLCIKRRDIEGARDSLQRMRRGATALGSAELARGLDELDRALAKSPATGLALVPKLTSAYERARLRRSEQDIVRSVAPARNAKGRPRYRVLLVDGDKEMRYFLEAILEQEGYDAKGIDDASALSQYCSDAIPDLVITELSEDSPNGLMLAPDICQTTIGRAVPTLVVSSKEDATLIKRAVDAGVEAVFSKPVNLEKLLQRIEKIFAARSAEKAVEKLTWEDSVTGLANRSRLMERLEVLVNRQRSPSDLIVLLALNLDRFKLINETLGHEAGDTLLREVGQRLCSCVRAQDTVARVGSDEFILAVDGMRSHENAERLAQNVQSTLAPHFNIAGTDTFVTASIGVATYPTDAQDAENLIKHAEAALSRAKGRPGEYQFYVPGMLDAASRRLSLEADLRRAIEREEFVLYYQPQHDVRSDGFCGAEALVRWDHPERGTIPPVDFIPLAEDTGLINPLGEWVLMAAARQAKAWQEQLPQLKTVSVNLSPRQFERHDLVRRIERAIDAAGVDPSSIELEITETAIMHDHADAIRKLAELRNMGFRLSVDDFGTGQTSLSYLKQFPVHSLKIDRSFIRGVPDDMDDAAIVRAILAMAHSLRLEVVAEGVETVEQKAYLVRASCDVLQGYLLGRPVPAGDFERLLKSGAAGADGSSNVTPFRR